MTKASNFKMNVIVNGGEFSVRVLARLDKISKFGIVCASDSKDLVGV